MEFAVTLHRVAGMDRFTLAINFFLGVCTLAGLLVVREQLRATFMRRANRR